VFEIPNLILYVSLLRCAANQNSAGTYVHGLTR